MNKRTDQKTAMLVDAAINAAAYSQIGAARALAEVGVPLEIAMRVLTRPQERRRYQLKPLSASRE